MVVSNKLKAEIQKITEFHLDQTNNVRLFIYHFPIHLAFPRSTGDLLQSQLIFSMIVTLFFFDCNSEYVVLTRS